MVPPIWSEAMLFEGMAELGSGRAPDAPPDIERQTTPRITDAPRELPRQSAAQMVEAVRNTREGTVELRLNPEELGRVRLSLSHGDGALAVTIAAERPETLDLMRRSVDQLASDLRALGYAGVDISFGRQGASGQGQGQSQTATGEEAPSPDHAASASTGRHAHGGRLDLRL